MSHPVHARVLGPLTLALDGRNAATPTARKQRQVLALLLMRYSTVVPVATLIEELWNDDPPRSAVTLVQTYVLGIRKRMAEYLDTTQAQVTENILRTTGKGYLFDTEKIVLDLSHYHVIANAARSSLGLGHDGRAVDLFAAAEDLWVGPPLLDVEPGVPLSADLSHLNQLRLTNLELRIQAQFRLGRDREVCPDLARLTIEHPLDERLQAYYLFSLCRTGQRYRALESYRDFARSMRYDLGLDPCMRLQRLHAVILNGADESLAEVLENRGSEYLNLGFRSAGDM